MINENLIMKRDSVEQWFSKIFTRDLNLRNKAFAYLLFSLLAIMLIVEALIFKYILLIKDANVIGMEIYIFVIVVAISFFISGTIVDFIKNRTRYLNLMLAICILGLLISAILV